MSIFWALRFCGFYFENLIFSRLHFEAFRFWWVLVFKKTVFEDLNILMVESLIFEGFLFEGLQFWRLQFLKVLILGTSIFKDFSFANKSTHYLAQTCTWGKNKSWWFHSAEKLRSIPTSSSSYVLTLPPSFRSKFIKSVYLPYKCLLEAGDTGQLQRAHALGPHIIEGSQA